MTQRTTLLLALCFSCTVLAQVGPREQDVAFTERWLAQVQAAGEPGALTAAAMAIRVHDPARAESFLARALASEHEPLLLSTVIYHCLAIPADAESPGFCTDALFTEMIDLDPDNLEPYLYALVRETARGNRAAAMQWLQAGLEAPLHDIYYIRKTERLMDAMTWAGYSAADIRYPAETYANVVDIYRLYAALMAACKTNSASDSDWKLACLYLGARLNIRSQALLPMVFGGAIMREVLIATDADPDLIARINERNDWVNSMRDMANEKVDWSSNTATVLDQPDSFIRDRSNGPEFEAILRAIFQTQ